MGTSVKKSALLFLCFLVCFGGFAQTGFYLTYPCKEGTVDIMKMDRNRKGVCITKNPIVTAADLHSVSNPIEIGNDFFFDIKLTERGFSKLEQVYPITALIVFRVHDQVVFLMDTKKDQLAGTIRVHIVGRKDVLESHDLLSKEIDRAKNQ